MRGKKIRSRLGPAGALLMEWEMGGDALSGRALSSHSLV